MNRLPATVLTVFLLTILLAALSIALEQKGYAFAALGIARLDSAASAATFVPLAALYAAAAALMMLLPLRGAGFIYANAASPLHAATLILLSTIVGVQAARFAYGDEGALWVLVDWRFLFAVALIVAHALMNQLRSNVLIRTLLFIVFIGATATCLYWTFRF